MNREELLEFARRAGIEVHPRKEQARIGMDALFGIDSTDKLEAFAALIRAATKEEDAKICESMEMPEFVHGAHPDYLDGKQMAFAQAATAIRESK